MAKRKPDGVVAEGGFLDYGTAKVDAKHRLLIKGPVEEHYRIYRNDAGQILLDPQVMVPAREAWLYKNKKAHTAVLEGIEQAKRGELVKLPSLAKHARDKLD